MAAAYEEFFSWIREASPTLLHFFGLKFVQKLVHCCDWLLTETQCKIILVQHVCRPKLLKNLCVSLVSGVPPLLFLGLHPCPGAVAIIALWKSAPMAVMNDGAI